VSGMIKIALLGATLILTVACAGPRAGVTWYEARCIDQYGMQRGTAEFSACVSREQRAVEETRARTDRVDP
jgi:hypothetical protein